MQVVLGGGNGIYLGGVYSPAPSVDPDAQAFITAASITDPTQQSAINQLVTDLKGYGIWTKMKALYPFVGGTASSHKFNLKDPRDLDAAFRLVFNGGITHSSTGIAGNGVNGYADTKFITGTHFTSSTSKHLSFYLRTNNVVSGDPVDMGSIDSGTANFGTDLLLNGNSSLLQGSLSTTSVSTPTTDRRGFSFTTKNGNSQSIWKNGSKLNTTTGTGGSTGELPIWLCGISLGSFSTSNFFPYGPTTNQFAFASIGDGLTDTEAANFYTAVQTFQVTLGRSIGTQTVSDADAQAFVTNAGIVDQVEANAVNNLVIGLKADGLWSKMKAIYPFVGGTASTHKFNLKNPLDTDAAFRLVFNGGWTHSATGATPNGVNAFADAFITNSAMSYTSTHLSTYSRTDANNSGIAMGNTTNQYCMFYTRNSGNFQMGINAATFNSVANANSLGHYIATRTASNAQKGYKNGLAITTSTNAVANDNTKMYIGAAFRTGVGALGYDNRQTAFASIGDGLTDTEATNFYTRVQAFNTTLNRQV